MARAPFSETLAHPPRQGLGPARAPYSSLPQGPRTGLAPRGEDASRLSLQPTCCQRAPSDRSLVELPGLHPSDPRFRAPPASSPRRVHRCTASSATPVRRCRLPSLEWPYDWRRTTRRARPCLTHRACAHSPEPCRPTRTETGQTTDTPSHALRSVGNPRHPDEHQDPFRVRRANAAASEARDAFHRPVSQTRLHASAHPSFEQVLATSPLEPAAPTTDMSRHRLPGHAHDQSPDRTTTAGFPTTGPTPVSERRPMPPDGFCRPRRSTSTPTTILRFRDPPRRSASCLRMTRPLRTRSADSP